MTSGKDDRSDGGENAVRRDRSRVVLVGLDEKLCERVRGILSSRYEVECASSATDAARIADADVIITEPRAVSDYRSTDRAEERTTPVILLVKSDTDLVGDDRRIVDFLVEPFTDRELLVRVGLRAGRSACRAKMDEALQKSEERYRAIVEGQAEMVCRFNIDGTIHFVNGAYARSRGARPEDLVGQNFWSWIDEEDRPGVRAMLDNLGPERPVVRIENRFETAEGVRWTLWTNRALTFDEEGRAEEIQSAGIEITERKEVEESLRESERKLALIIDTAPAFIAYMGPDCRYRLVNRGYADRFDLTPADLEGRHLREIVGDEAFQTVKHHVETVLAGESVEFEEEINISGAGRRTILARYAPEITADGEVEGFIAVVNDVTERRKSEADLRQAHDLIEGITKGTEEFIAAIDKEYRFTYFNDAYRKEFERLWGNNLEVGDDLLEALERWPEERKRVEEIWSRALRGETYQTTQEFGPSPDDRQTYELKFNPVRRPDGEILGAAHIIRNVTDRMRMQNALRESDRRQRIAVDAAGLGVFEWVPEHGYISFENERIFQIFGRSSEEGPLSREQFEESYLMPDDHLVVETAMRRAYETRERLHVVCRIRIPGESDPRWVEIAGNFTDDRGRPRLVGVVADITDRKRAERDQALLAAVVASSKDAIVSKTIDGIITSWNEGAEEIFGYSSDEAIGQSILMIIPPDRLEEEEYILGRIRSGQSVDHYETIRRRKDGSRIDVSVSVSPMKDADGNVIGASKVARDVTSRKRAEEALRESEERLRALNQTLEWRVEERTADLEDRNKELQAFAYIASHDLREPLRKIQAFADLLQDETGEALSQQGSFFLDRMRSAAERMDGLLLDLLSFSRVATEVAPPEPVHVEELAHDVLRDYELTIRDTGAKVELDADVTVEADRAQLRQLMTNLVGNALKYRRPDTAPLVNIRASIESEACELDDTDGPVCRIVVEDNGIGFEEKYGNRIFEPFERLHERVKYEGTGMGLAIARRIAQRHRGTIEARSTPGEGSRFTVCLPIKQAR